MKCVSSLNFYDGKSGTAGSSGFDLFLPEDTTFPAGKTLFVDFKISAACGTGFWLVPRSSISKGPLRMANSVGLIDPNYRGNLIAALTNTSSEDFTVAKGTRLVQIVKPDLCPFEIEWVESLDETSRGAGGFGSTGT